MRVVATSGVCAALAIATFATAQDDATRSIDARRALVTFGTERAGIVVGERGVVITATTAVVEAAARALSAEEFHDGFHATERSAERGLPGCVAELCRLRLDVTERIDVAPDSDHDAAIAASAAAVARTRAWLEESHARDGEHVIVRSSTGGAHWVAEVRRAFVDVRLIDWPGAPRTDSARPDGVCRLRLYGDDGPWPTEGVGVRPATERPEPPFVLVAPPPTPLEVWSAPDLAFLRDHLLPRQVRAVDEAIGQIEARWSTPARAAATRPPSILATLWSRRSDREQLVARLAALRSTPVLERCRAIERALSESAAGRDALAAFDASCEVRARLAVDGGAETERHVLQRRLPELRRRVARLALEADAIPTPVADARVISIEEHDLTGAIPSRDEDDDQLDTPTLGPLRGSAAAQVCEGSAIVDGEGRLVAVVTAVDANARGGRAVAGAAQDGRAMLTRVPPRRER